MKSTLFALLLILGALALSSCRTTECIVHNKEPNALYIVSYDHPPTSRQDILRTADANGDLTYPVDANGNCGAVTITLTGPGFLDFSASPDSIDLNSPPSTMMVNGSGISNQYYMPNVEFYDNNSSFVGSTTAVDVAGDGSWLVVYTPDLSGVYSGNYQVEVVNFNADQSRDLIGVANVYAYGRDDTSCNPTAQEVADCENCCGVQTYWDYSSCRCWLP